MLAHYAFGSFRLPLSRNLSGYHGFVLVLVKQQAASMHGNILINTDLLVESFKVSHSIEQATL